MVALLKRRNSLIAVLVVFHLMVGSAGIPSLAESEEPHHQSATDPDIASTTKDCVSCHDGALAQEAYDRRFNHPTGMDYQTRLVQSNGKLKPIDASFPLEDGKVGCLTCHDLNSDLPSKLITGNQGSRLCFTCHNL